MTEYEIAHLFADYGCESEALASFGTVHRYTIDPKPNPFVENTVSCDLMERTPDRSFDLAVLHPKCTKWADMPNVDPDEHENQIPRARALGQEIADHYILENKPRAPLEDPTVLHAKMFGLPIAYERAFETSFRVKQPPRQQSLDTDTSPFYYSERCVEWWKGVKGLSGDYPKEHVAKNALPSAYVRYLCMEWLDAIGANDTGSDYSNYDEEMETERRSHNNATLGQ
jgi:hypothetical protein